MSKLIKVITVCLLMITMVGCESSKQPTPTVTPTSTPDTTSQATDVVVDDIDGQPIDAITSVSIVVEDALQTLDVSGFSDSDKKKVLMVIGDPRKNSVNYDLAITAAHYFEEKGMEVEVRDLYELEFNPVLYAKDFYYAKDGFGEVSPEIKVEQDFVTQADHIVFVYPNWHDTPNAIVKGYMETVFAKQFAYESTSEGLAGKLVDKSIFTIMNAGFLGGGRGYIYNGVGIDDEAWNVYMNAFKVLDDDTAKFWGVNNFGRFVNDRTPKNNSETYVEELDVLRSDLKAFLDTVYFN